MASHNQPDNVTPLHRGVRPIAAQDLQRIFDPRPNLNDTFAESLQRDAYSRPTLLERATDFFNTGFGFGFYTGFVAGCLFTVGAAFLWGLAL